MARKRDQEAFLKDCDDSEREIFTQVFTDLQAVATTISNETATAPNPVTIDLSFEDDAASRVSAAVRLQSAQTKPVTLLWIFPSRGPKREGSRNGIELNPRYLRESKIRETDIENYGSALRGAEFKIAKASWRTVTAGTSDGFSRLFGWAANRQALADAVLQLSRAVSGYHAEVASTGAPGGITQG